MGKQKIVWIEDDMVLSKIVKEELEEANFEVWTAFDGLTGLKLVKSKKPDLVLLDLLLPKLDGLSLLKKMKGDPEIADTPVVVLSNYGDTERIATAMEYGVENYLIKSAQGVTGAVKKIKETLK